MEIIKYLFIYLFILLVNPALLTLYFEIGKSDFLGGRQWIVTLICLFVIMVSPSVRLRGGPGGRGSAMDAILFTNGRHLGRLFYHKIITHSCDIVYATFIVTPPSLNLFNKLFE